MGKKAKRAKKIRSFMEWRRATGSGWHHFACTWPKRGLPTLYVDGRVDGLHDEFVAWDRALTIEEIKALYASGSPLNG